MEFDKEFLEEFSGKERYTYADLLTLMEILRSPQGCPWDRAQTHHSIRPELLEEAYEVAEAIDTEDPGLLREELGDLLLQVVFHARISEEEGMFSMEQVVDELCHKLVYRHPHVFAGEKPCPDLTRWEQLKRQEKGRDTLQKNLDSIPITFPAVLRAQKILSRMEKSGVPAPKTDALPPEWAQALAAMSPEEREAYAGQKLFAMVALARSAGVNSEEALTRENKRVQAELLKNGKFPE